MARVNVMSSSKLLCTMIWGATVWGLVIIIMACSRMNINFQFTRDLRADCHLEMDRPLERTARDSFSELPAPVASYARQVFAGDQLEDGPGSRSLDSMCTLVMLTYNREKILKFLLNHYCKVRSLHKIIVIWNNVNKSIPDDVLEVKEKRCFPDLLFIQEKENKLTNRFKPRPEIETNCVCIMDDDRFIIDLRDLELGFSVWQNFKHRIVGFEHRTHFQLENGSFWYDLSDSSKPRKNYSMILTSTAIVHKTYLWMFFDDSILPKGMIEYIDERKNCEDIALNVMVAKFLADVGRGQAAALAIRPRREVRNMEYTAAKTKSSYTGLSSLPDHYTERSRCLNDFRDMYGGQLILPHATFIIESLLTTPKRNRTYISRYHNITRNASRAFFIRSHNITKSRPFNISEQQKLYELFLAQKAQNYSRSNHLLSSHQSRSSNNVTGQMRPRARQVYVQSEYTNSTQIQRSHQQSQQQKPLKGGQRRPLNGTQFQRQNHNPHLELKPVGAQRQSRNPVSKSSIR